LPVIAAVVVFAGFLRYSDVAVVLVHEDQMVFSDGDGIPCVRELLYLSLQIGPAVV
jgi:hypothetical protein